MSTSNLLDRSEEKFVPQMAIIVYREGHTSYYLEKRDIENGKMGAGVPLTEKTISEIVSSLSENQSNVPYGRIPENMLYADPRPGHQKYVWYRGPEKRKFYFTKSLNIPEGDILIPGMLYVVEKASLSIYAFMGSRPRRKLYRAPFFNVYNDNHVCLGTAKVSKPKELTYENIMAYWEQMFWNSEFAGLLGGNPIKGNLATLTKKCIKTGCKFPVSELLPLKRTLEELI